MSALKIIRLGHPVLRQKSKAVNIRELKTKAFQSFLDDLVKICDKNNGVGIAAPQVGINKKVIVVHVDPKNPRYPGKKPFPTTILINPKIDKRSKAVKEDWEGDLSCGFKALVPRPKSCRVSGLNRHGNQIKFNLTYDFHARVFQHEIDHLNGRFLIDRVKRRETVTELAEWERYWKNKKLSELTKS